MLRVWLKEYIQEERVLKNKSDNTLRAYRRDILQLLDFLDKLNLEIKGIKEKHIKDFLQDLKRENISKRSINRKLSSIKGYFKFLENEKSKGYDEKYYFFLDMIIKGKLKLDDKKNIQDSQDDKIF